MIIPGLGAKLICENKNVPKTVPKAILDQFMTGVRSLGHSGSFKTYDDGNFALLCKHCQVSIRILFTGRGRNASYGLYYIGYNWVGQLMISYVRNGGRHTDRTYYAMKEMYVCPRAACFL